MRFFVKAFTSLMFLSIDCSVSLLRELYEGKTVVDSLGGLIDGLRKLYEFRKPLFVSFLVLTFGAYFLKTGPSVGALGLPFT